MFHVEHDFGAQIPQCPVTKRLTGTGPTCSRALSGSSRPRSDPAAPSRNQVPGRLFHTLLTPLYSVPDWGCEHYLPRCSVPGSSVKPEYRPTSNRAAGSDPVMGFGPTHGSGAEIPPPRKPSMFHVKHCQSSPQSGAVRSMSTVWSGAPQAWGKALG